MQSKDKLKRDVEKKIKTTMIGAISAIEGEFGFLFGYDKEKEEFKKELTDEESSLHDIFQELRFKILELGNKQIKKAKLDIDLYEVRGPYYKYDFKITKN